MGSNKPNSQDKTNQTGCATGGTCILSCGTLTHRSGGSGLDHPGPGRWMWSLFEGKNTMKLCVVSMHIPCANFMGEICIHAQHECHLQSQDDDPSTRKAFLEDFEKELEQSISAGEQVIVKGDVNESAQHADACVPWPHLFIWQLKRNMNHDHSKSEHCIPNKQAIVSLQDAHSPLG